jgi:hypothetical protein
MCGDFEASYDLTNQGHRIPLMDPWYMVYQALHPFLSGGIGRPWIGKAGCKMSSHRARRL